VQIERPPTATEVSMCIRAIPIRLVALLGTTETHEWLLITYLLRCTVFCDPRKSVTGCHSQQKHCFLWHFREPCFST
jgi:hypothetical protein